MNNFTPTFFELLLTQLEVAECKVRLAENFQTSDEYHTAVLQELPWIREPARWVSNTVEQVIRDKLIPSEKWDTYERVVAENIIEGIVDYNNAHTADLFEDYLAAAQVELDLLYAKSSELEELWCAEHGIG